MTRSARRVAADDDDAAVLGEHRQVLREVHVGEHLENDIDPLNILSSDRHVFRDALLVTFLLDCK